MPASWVFNHVLERIAADLRGGRPEIADKVANALFPRMEYLDLSSWSPEDFSHFRASLESTQVALKGTDGADFLSRDFYEGYLARVEELSTLLYSDPRRSR